MAPSEHDDATVALLAAATGDEHAFARFYDEVSDVVFGIVSRVLRNAAMAEEVTQEVFVELWRQAPQFDPGRGLARSWAATFAHRRAVDRVRSEQAARRRDEHDAAVRSVGHDVVADEVVEAITTEADHARVSASLAKLSDTQREALTLAYFEGHTYREVAALLGAPEGTVKTRIRDGLMKLRSLMEEAS